MTGKLSRLGAFVMITGLFFCPAIGAVARPSDETVAGGQPKQEGGAGPRSTLFVRSNLAAWVNQSANPDRITRVRDPSGSADTALKFTAFNSDIAPLTPTDNPRAQLLTRAPDSPFWESYEVYLPKSFPLSHTYDNKPWNQGNFVGLGSPFYGAPWSGSPSTGLGIFNGRFRWQTNIHAPAGSKILWQRTATRGRWTRFTWHIVPSTHGFAELYVDDRPARVTYNGKTQDGVDIPVIDATDYLGPWASQLAVYYAHNQFPKLTIYFKAFAIGLSQAAAEMR
jgi:hypothetical protein